MESARRLRVYELAEMKRRAEDSRVAERVENVMLSGVP